MTALSPGWQAAPRAPRPHLLNDPLNGVGLVGRRRFPKGEVAARVAGAALVLLHNNKALRGGEGSRGVRARSADSAAGGLASDTADRGCAGSNTRSRRAEARPAGQTEKL